MDYGYTDCGNFGKSEIKIKNDTLITNSTRSSYRYAYYIKQKIPKEWLDYKPDY